MKLSNEYENLFLDLFRGYSIPAIEEFYVGLIKTDGSEVVGASYGRINIQANPNTWQSTQGTVGVPSSGTTGLITNTTVLTWGTALETWGNVDRIRFFTHPTSDAYFCDHDITSVNITSGTDVTILVGDFEITTRND